MVAAGARCVALCGCVNRKGEEGVIERHRLLHGAFSRTSRKERVSSIMQDPSGGSRPADYYVGLKTGAMRWCVNRRIGGDAFVNRQEVVAQTHTKTEGRDEGRSNGVRLARVGRAVSDVYRCYNNFRAQALRRTVLPSRLPFGQSANVRGSASLPRMSRYRVRLLSLQLRGQQAIEPPIEPLVQLDRRRVRWTACGIIRPLAG